MLIFQKFHTISDNSKKYIFILNKIIDRKYFTTVINTDPIKRNRNWSRYTNNITLNYDP